jgi:hypothetical protein
VTRDATAAEALKLDASVVAAYDSLFFNVLDRKADIPCIRKLIGTAESKSSLLLSRREIPTDEETILLVGFNGTIEDVLRHATCAGGAGHASIEELTDRLIRNILAKGADWMVSPGSRRQPPPESVSHAIEFAKRSKAKPAEVPPAQTGMSIGETMRMQLEQDATVIRNSMAPDLIPSIN